MTTPRKKYPDPLATIDPIRVLTGFPHDPVVYFLRIGNSVKIGTSTNLRLRLTSLSLLPKNIVLLVPGGLETERLLHRKFKAQHIQGEWFTHSGELQEFLIAYITRLSERVAELLSSDFAEPIIIKAEPGTHEYPMTLRQMCEAKIIPVQWSAAKRARTRAAHTFPIGKQTPNGTEYEPKPVREFFAGRTRKPGA